MTVELLEKMTAAALAAGEVIMQVYADPISSEQKSDGSPVTIADEKAEVIIGRMLRDTGIPMLAEESAAAGNIPELGSRFFVVDPLDGTKEFIKRNGQFTVNIALVENGVPVMGVVLAPALDVNYRGSAEGAYRCEKIDGVWGAWTKIEVVNDGPFNIVASRSHGHAALEDLCAEFAVDDNVSVGSSLKFCILAEGKAQLYPRFTPTCEWDTAAGQAVLQAAGGAVFGFDGLPLNYGKSDGNFYNPYFAAAANVDSAKKCIEKMRFLIGNEGFIENFKPR